MNPASSAMPKAAAMPARLLRTSRQCSNQGPSTSQIRGYHAPTASGTGRRLRETTPGQKKQHPAYVSSRVSGCGTILYLCGTVLIKFFSFSLLIIDIPYDCSPSSHTGSVQSPRSRQECFCGRHQKGILRTGEEISPGYQQRTRCQGQVRGGTVGL